MSEPLAAATKVWKSYDAGRVTVLRDVSFSVKPGELVALWGPSGSGKSTLLHLLGGLDSPDRGEITICGLSPRSERDRLELRRRQIGFVFQLHNLIADLTVAENLRIPSIAAGVSAATATARVNELTSRVGIAHRVHHRVQDLSGGERQRTALCRALMHRPRLILADEPTGALDEDTGAAVFALLRELSRAEGTAVVLATHERRFAEACDRLVHVHDGTLRES